VATSVSAVLHRTVLLLTLLISENIEYIHCICTSSGVHTKVEAGDCQSCMPCEASCSQQVLWRCFKQLAANHCSDVVCWRACILCIQLQVMLSAFLLASQVVWSINDCYKGTCNDCHQGRRFAMTNSLSLCSVTMHRFANCDRSASGTANYAWLQILSCLSSLLTPKVAPKLTRACRIGVAFPFR